MKKTLSAFTSDPLVRKVVKALTAPHPAESHLARELKCSLAEGDLDDLFNRALVPARFGTALDYLECVSIRDLFRKLELPNEAAKAAAEEQFLKCEDQCFESNFYLSHLSETSETRKILEKAHRLCRSILGPLPNKINGRHGPGTAVGLLSAASTVADKMNQPPTRTKDSDIFLPQWRENHWGRSINERFGSDLETSIVRGNKFTTVMKDLRKMRGICIEPSFNVYHQLGIGSFIRKRLLNVGIDLEGGQQLHRDLAQKASILGTHATIDLSNASDTICSELVRILLPDDWYDLLDQSRSRFTFYKGKWKLLEKFSSMGNGFTFELETLIFYCLILAATGLEPNGLNQPLVYGDDIIVLTEHADVTLTILQQCGFTPNSEKTFKEGPFRESCGGDFFWGADVRPFFLKHLPDRPERAIAMANGLYRLATKFPSEHPFRRNILVARLRVLDSIPSNIRSAFGPTELGDICIHCDDPYSFGVVSDSIRKFRVYKPASFKHVSWGHYDPLTVLTCALLGVGDGLRGVTPRNAVTGFKLGWVALS